MLKQFVPSTVCLSCDGCCRFKEADSRWRPKVGAQEKKALTLADQIFSSAVDGQGYLKTKACHHGEGEHLCHFFHRQDHTCGVYGHRPFECQLYPFLLTRWQEKTALCAHGNCPYVQEHFGSTMFQQYVDYLQEYFSREETKKFLQVNPSLVGDYSGYEAELHYLFAIDGKGQL